MDPLAFFATSRLVIVAGKGGVGKTTVTAALAAAAAKSGLRVLIVEVEGKGGLGRLFGVGPLRYDELVLLEAEANGPGRVVARTITPNDALLEYLEDHGMRRLSNRLVRGGALDVVATAAPGIEDILVLGKVKQLERSGSVDLILLDAPAAGHAITFLESARGLLDAVTVGPINTQARDVMELLTDPERCSVLLVTLPEETPVNELVDTAYSLEDRVGVSLGPVVVNGLYPRTARARCRSGGGRRRGEGGAHAGRGGRARCRCRVPRRAARRATRADRPALRAPAAAADPSAVRVHHRPVPCRCARARRRGTRGHHRPRRHAVTAAPTLEAILSSSSIVLCCGTGGVGKTTTAAAIAMHGARVGRRSVVVTIDPAKRLADALGLEGLTNTPSRIEGEWSGELWALMLDTKTTFDELVARNAADQAQVDRILGNRFYRNISGRLSGTQEYMAMEKLYELHEESQFDLVVVDTPPTRNALDFLDAPRRLTRFLDHRLYRILMTPGRAYVRAVNVAAQAFLRTVSKVVGGDVIDDAIAFFQAFEGMEAGFRDRAERVLHLLSAPETAFVLVASPRGDTVGEASYFADRLAEGGISVSALVVNRMHPHFGTGRPEATRERARTLSGSDLGELYANLADFQLVAASEEDHLAGLAGRVAPAPVVRVPFLTTDVHDLDGLDEIAGHLFR